MIWDRSGATTARSRSLVALLFVLLLAGGWAGPAARRLAAGAAADPPLEQRLAGEALRAAGAPDRIATNTSMLAFYAHDPRLFGVPGSYRPLPSDLTCFDLARALPERGATVALMELGQFQPAVEITPGCSLRLVASLTMPESPRALGVYLPEEGDSVRPEVSTHP